MTVEETWELARKLYKSEGIKGSNFNEIFGCKMRKKDVFAMSPYKVKFLIDKFDEEKKIHVGDLVKQSDGTVGIILDIVYDNHYNIFSENGCIESVNSSDLTKIRHTKFIDELLKKLHE